MRGYLLLFTLAGLEIDVRAGLAGHPARGDPGDGVGELIGRVDRATSHLVLLVLERSVRALCDGSGNLGRMAGGVSWRNNVSGIR